MTAAFWDKRAQAYDEDIQKHDGRYDQTINASKALLSEADVVLDFGCASGEISLDIAPHVQQIQGIDLSGKMIELARQKAYERQIENAHFEQIDLFDQRLESWGITAVVALNVFHLVKDASRTLDRLHQLLPTGGVLISQTPCLSERGWIFRTLINLAQKLGAAPAICSFTFDDLETAVAGSNFELLEARIWDKADKVYWVVARKA